EGLVTPVQKGTANEERKEVSCRRESKVRSQRLRGGTPQAASRAVQTSGVGKTRGEAHHYRLRGSRWSRQRRHHQSHHRACQSTCIPRRRTSRSVRPREDAN